jgi:hypothetical protein
VLAGDGDDVRAEVESRIVDLSHLVASVSWWTVWDLPWCVWLGYAALVDQRRRALSERGAGNG